MSESVFDPDGDGLLSDSPLDSRAVFAAMPRQPEAGEVDDDQERD